MPKKDTFLLVSLQEQQAKELAQVITNNTCRSILDFLAEHLDATETNIAQSLNIPLSTVHYNLDLLVKAKLIDAEEFHYSQKGKEVLHYKLASKYIIIAPKSTYGIKEKLKSILPVALITAGAAWVINALSKTALYAGTLTQETFGISQKAAIVATESAATISDAAVQEAEATALNVAPAYAEPGVDALAASASIPSIWQNPIAWFVIGALFAIILYFMIDYLRYRRLQRGD